MDEDVGAVAYQLFVGLYGDGGQGKGAEGMVAEIGDGVQGVGKGAVQVEEAGFIGERHGWGSFRVFFLNYGTGWGKNQVFWG